MGSSSVKWSSLPRDILSSIANLLDPDSDHHRIRAVCSSWRSNLSHLASVSTTAALPIKVPPPGSSYTLWNLDCQQGNFLLNECILYRLAPLGGSSSSKKSTNANGWMIKVSKTHCNSQSYSVLVPLSVEKIKAPMGSLPKTLNRLSYDFTEICRSYNIQFLNHGESSPASCAPVHTRRTVVLRNYVTGYDFVVLILSYGGTIKFWRIGDKDWTQIENDGICHFDDVVLYEGKCYAIDKLGRLFLIDSALRPIEVATSFGNFLQQGNYLVVGLDSELYAVVKISSPDPDYYFNDGFPDVDERTIDMPIRLHVFKLNKASSDWEYTDDVGDQVFFIGDDATFCVFARGFKGCKGNCVYLTDECFLEDNEGGAYGEDTGVYDLKTWETLALAAGQNYATFFWPPPSWLVTDDSSGKTGPCLKMSSGSDKWSSLPKDLLSAIADLLDTDSDRLRICAVCAAWRSNLSGLASVSHSLTLPINVPPPQRYPTLGNLDSNQGSYLLNEGIVYRISPPLGGTKGDNNSRAAGGWMIKVSKTNFDSEKYSLLVPLSTEKIKAPMVGFPKTLNSLDYDVTEICHSYNIQFLCHGESSPGSFAYTKRTVVLQNYVIGFDFVVLILSYAGTIKFWRIEDTKWTHIETDRNCHFDDVVLFKGQCYAIDKLGRLFLIDSSLRPIEVVSSFGCQPEQENYLVVGLDSELYAVSKISYPDPDYYFYDGFPDVDEGTLNMPIQLHVFKLNKRRNYWEHTDNVGDQVFFLGSDATFCVFARDLKGCKGNCVYLTDDCFFEDNEGGAYGEETGVYDLATGETLALATGESYATFFWPPPSWLGMDADSLQ